MSDRTVSVGYHSDLLCIWAYVAQARLDELRRNFRDTIEVTYHFVPVFGSAGRLRRRWADRGGLEAYAKHVREVAAGFDHVTLDPDLWSKPIPAGSMGLHAFCKAVALLEAPTSGDSGDGGRTPFEELMWRLRLAFFRDGLDVGRLDRQMEVAEAMGFPGDAIRERLEDGSALAALADDHELADRLQVTGSPTFVLNEGRQKLYGNVGYRVIEANIQELLRDNSSRASWC
jgi:predicted DsbA family dithiol-disulfide isomerase